MTEDTTTPAPSEPVAGPVQRKLGHATEARWYCLDRDGVAMLCKDEADARAQAVENDDCWPGRAPHRAVLLGDVAAERERCAKPVPDEWLVKVRRLVQGFEHVSGIARLWEPDYSSGNERALWSRATEACADVAKLLREAEGPNVS